MRPDLELRNRTYSSHTVVQSMSVMPGDTRVRRNAHLRDLYISRELDELLRGIHGRPANRSWRSAPGLKIYLDLTVACKTNRVAGMFTAIGSSAS